MIREVNGGNGYAGQSSPARALRPRRRTAAIASIQIRWPSGIVQTVTAPVDRITTIHEAAPARHGPAGNRARPRRPPGPPALVRSARSVRRVLRSILFVSALFAVLTLAPQPAGRQTGDLLWQHRNLGKAFYENPTTQLQAVDEFKKALDLAPDSARERSTTVSRCCAPARPTEGIAELQKAQQQDPDHSPHLVQPGHRLQEGRAVRQGDRAVRADGQARARRADLALQPGRPLQADRQAGRRAARVRTRRRARSRTLPARTSSCSTPTATPAVPPMPSASSSCSRRSSGDRRALPFPRISTGASTPRSSIRSIRPTPWNRPARGVDLYRHARAGDVCGRRRGHARPRRRRGRPPGPARMVRRIGRALQERRHACRRHRPRGHQRRSLDRGRRLQQRRPAGSRGRDRCRRRALWQPKGAFSEGAAGAAGLGRPAGHLDRLRPRLRPGSPARRRRVSCSSATTARPASATRRRTFRSPTATRLDGVAFNFVADTAGRDVVVTYADHAAVLYRDLLGGKYRAEPLDALGAGAAAVVARDVDDDGSDRSRRRRDARPDRVAEQGPAVGGGAVHTVARARDCRRRTSRTARLPTCSSMAPSRATRPGAASPRRHRRSCPAPSLSPPRISTTTDGWMPPRWHRTARCICCEMRARCPAPGSASR